MIATEGGSARSRIVGIAFVIVLFFQPLQGVAQKLDMEKFKDMTPRYIGPAGMSGRVTAIDVVRDNPDVTYAGTASGGLWKSESGGVDWKPVFDDQQAASIGAVDIH